MEDTIRTDKLLSSLGIASRRSIDRFLKQNIVSSDDKRLLSGGDRVKKESKIYINGKLVKKPDFVYYKLNKPKGYISTVKDEFNRKNVIDLINSSERIFPVGRLDKDTHGLLLLTNDGELTNNLIHPKKHVQKIYELTILGNIDNKKLLMLEKGVMLEEGITQEAKVKIIFRDQKKTVINLTIYEGKKRQIRRMCDALRLNLKDLKRIQFGPIKLGDLKLGESKSLTNKELSLLKNSY